MTQLYSGENYTFGELKHGTIFNLGGLIDSYREFKTSSPNYNIDQSILRLSNQFTGRHEYSENKRYFITTSIHAQHHLNTVENKSLIDSILSNLIFFKLESNKVLGKLENFKQADRRQYTNRVYIPGIRTLRLFGIKANIANETINEYKFDTKVSVFNGQDFPTIVFDGKNSEYWNRQPILDFQN